jgi:hypothetical protein
MLRASSRRLGALPPCVSETAAAITPAKKISPRSEVRTTRKLTPAIVHASAPEICPSSSSASSWSIASIRPSGTKMTSANTSSARQWRAKVRFARAHTPRMDGPDAMVGAA